jgi:hypothetical protein
MKNLLLFLLPVGFFLTNCESTDFYSTKEYRGNPRIPMIKPYIVKSNDSGNNWSLELKFTTISAPKLIGVKDSVFAVFVERDFAPGFTSGLSNTWYIVDTRSDSEMACDSKERYKIILDSLGVLDLELYDVMYVYDGFNKESGVLPEGWPKGE